MPKMTIEQREEYRRNVLQKITVGMPAVMQEYAGTDWMAATKDYRTDHEFYPEYLHAPIHGLNDGYFTPQNCLSWDVAMDAILQASHKVSDREFRDGLGKLIPADAQVQTVLELGAGTAEGSLVLAQRLSAARFTITDVSPYMLVIARHKFEQANVADRAKFEQVDARHTPYADNSFDMVTASLIFHEAPKAVTLQILQEMYRVTKPGGWVVYADTFRGAHSLNDSFMEPWLPEFREINFEYEFARAGFDDLNYVRFAVGLWYMVGRKPA